MKVERVQRVVRSRVGSSALIDPGSSRLSVDVVPDQSILWPAFSTSYKMRGSRFTPLAASRRKKRCQDEIAISDRLSI